MAGGVDIGIRAGVVGCGGIIMRTWPGISSKKPFSEEIPGRSTIKPTVSMMDKSLERAG
jgi:hypothetical protein